ncbi:MAG: site-specific integrase [Pseudomonadales bacterium]|nr:site-specific integrase [Pseudomonadales bacterium]
MGYDAKQTFYAKVVIVRFNAGSLPYFCGRASSTGLRHIAYHKDHWVDGFPLIWCPSRVTDALEMNLFLEHRYKGQYLRPRRGGLANPLGGVTLKTLKSIANSLASFMAWLSEHNVDWREVTAYSATDKAKYWLPVYRFRKHLIDRVAGNSLGRDTANLYMSHVRQFYEWARRRGQVGKLPFSYSNLVIKKKREDDAFDLLFSAPVTGRSIVIQTTDLSIPKKYRQKIAARDVLSPYTKEELVVFYGTRYMSYPTRRLWADMALVVGLRASEIAAFSEDKAVNPFEDGNHSYYVNIVGKGNKERDVLVPRSLMTRLWEYRNTMDRLARAAKWDIKNGLDGPRPLFLNRSGKSINVNSISNLTSIARKELLEQGKEFRRSFHDLRATYATNMTKFMLDHGLDASFIEYKLMSLLGHSNFTTTKKYLNYARSISFDMQMKGWTNTIFEGLEKRLQEELDFMVDDNAH